MSTTRHASLEPSASTTTAATPRREHSPVLPPPPPDDGEKYAYVHRNLPYLTITLVVSASCVIISQIRFELHDPALWPFLVFTTAYVIYQVISLPVNFTGHGFDLAAHQARVQAWHPASYPSVDIYLPICGEPIEVLRNTWNAVFELIAGYPGLAQAYVLDDGPSDEASSVSASFGFRYVRRPDLRVYRRDGSALVCCRDYGGKEEGLRATDQLLGGPRRSGDPPCPGPLAVDSCDNRPPSAWASTFSAGAKAFAANDKISVGCIGVRLRGNSVMQSFAAEPDCEITHICDVNRAVREQRGAEMEQKTGRMPTLINDYRTLLDDRSVDVFMVATPDHGTLFTIDGCLHGKDVYVEKPSSHNILEGKTAAATARKRDRMVQVGTQIRTPRSCTRPPHTSGAARWGG